MASAKILLVDDEPDVVASLGMRLGAAGYQIVTASDGMSATQKAVQEQPDMIVLDIGMPGGDGHTVAQRLNENPATAGIPIVFLTARITQEDMNKATAEGAVGYMLKPFNSERLLALVERVLSERAKVGG